MISEVAGALFMWFLVAAVAALALGSFINTGDEAAEDEGNAADYVAPE